jgi:prepilin-type processing-associated H-X9-DG protein
MGNEDHTGCQLPYPCYWENAMWTYIHSTGNNSVSQCPDDTSITDQQQESTNYVGQPGKGFSYLANDNLCISNYNGAGPTCTWTSVGLSQVVSPTQCIAMTEGISGFGHPYIAQAFGCFVTGAGEATWVESNPVTVAQYSIDNGCPISNIGSRQSDLTNLPWHSMGSNFTFVDGHAKWYKDVVINGNVKTDILQTVLPFVTNLDPSQGTTNVAGDLNGSRQWG